jgi:hypothetical protein
MFDALVARASEHADADLRAAYTPETAEWVDSDPDLTYDLGRWR